MRPLGSLLHPRRTKGADGAERLRRRPRACLRRHRRRRSRPGITRYPPRRDRRRGVARPERLRCTRRLHRTWSGHRRELGRAVRCPRSRDCRRSSYTHRPDICESRHRRGLAVSNVLLISYYFPPIGGAGAQRPVKFARYLLEQGHRPTVLTGSGHTGGLWTPSDATLASDLPPEVRIIRVPGPEPSAGDALRSRLRRIARIESEWSRWWQHGIVEAGGDLSSIDVIYTIMSPYTSAEPSRALARKLGIGWIADLGDPWALDEMILYPTGVHRRLELAHMGRLLGSASAIIMSTREAVRQVLENFPRLEGRPVVAITNGYDAAVFDDDPAPRDPTRFRIVHTGYLHTELGLQQRRRAWTRRLLGGGIPGVDILTRSHVYLLEAVEDLLKRDPSLRDRLELHFAGVLSETDRRLAAASPVSVLHGYLSHADSIALMRSADLLFLPMQNLPAGRRSSTVPGKTYEYLASGRPILAAVPPGDTRDTVLSVGHAVCDPDDTKAIADTIASRINNPGEDPEVSMTLVRAFEGRELTRQLADVLRVVAPETTPDPPVPVG